MRTTRRDLLIALATLPILSTIRGSAKGTTLQAIVTGPGTRLYPTGAYPQSWTTEPVSGWSYPTPTQTPDYTSLGLSSVPDGATRITNYRNTPQAGAYTKAYFQWSTRPLNGDQLLSGTVSAAIHCTEGNLRVNALLALQVVVHRPDGSVRGIALPISADTLEFPVANPPKTRAAQQWPLQAVQCLDGDVIAVNVGTSVNNQTHVLAYTVGFDLYADQTADIAFVDDATLGNTWVEFSAPLNFR